MKTKTILLTAMMACVSLAEDSKKETKVTEVDQNSVVWTYEAYAELPTSAKKLAGYVSADYNKAEDEFEREELLEKIKPIIKKRIEKAKKQELLSIKVGSNLPEYNFEKKGFSTGISEKTFYPFGNRYAAKLGSLEGVDFIPMAKEDAKLLLKKLGKHRNCQLEIVGQVDEAKDITLNRYMRKTIFILPTKLKLYSAKGVKLYEKEVK